MATWDMFKMLDMVGNYESRKLALLNAEDNEGIGVSTVAITDMSGFSYETALLHGGEPNTVVVERYHDLGTATIRHEHWIGQAKVGNVVTHLGCEAFGILLEDREVTLEL